MPLFLAVIGAVSGALGSLLPKLLDARKTRAEAADTLVDSAGAVVSMLRARLDDETAERKHLSERVEELMREVKDAERKLDVYQRYVETYRTSITDLVCLIEALILRIRQCNVSTEGIDFSVMERVK